MSTTSPGRWPVTFQPVIWHDAQPMGGTATAGGVTTTWAAVTDVGNHRSVNEDSLLAAAPVFVVADGMGGHHAGDVASQLVVERFQALADDDLRSVEEVVGLLEDVNRSILDRGRRSRALSGMGTTAVGLLLVDNGDRASWLLFNIGDSRAYRRTEGRFEQLSVDHSYVQELVDAGEITARSARSHPHRNVVTRALGVDEGPKPDLWLHSPRVGERFLLCSDGLSSEVDDDDIAKVLAVGTPEQAAAALVARAIEAGGHDNVTVLVVDVVEVDDEVSSAITSPRELVLSELTVPRLGVATATATDDPTREQPVVPSDPPAFDSTPSSGLIDRVPGQDELEDLTAAPGSSGGDDVVEDDPTVDGPADAMEGERAAGADGGDVLSVDDDERADERDGGPDVPGAAGDDARDIDHTGADHHGGDEDVDGLIRSVGDGASGPDASDETDDDSGRHADDSPSPPSTTRPASRTGRRQRGTRKRAGS